jgi:hypothetical protein
MAMTLTCCGIEHADCNICGGDLLDVTAPADVQPADLMALCPRPVRIACGGFVCLCGDSAFENARP